MKKILLLASAVALMASCSQSEDFGAATELTTGEISFTNAFVNNSQRKAGEMTNATIATADNTFGVWGYKTVGGTNTSVFDNVEVKFDGTAKKWDYTNKRYWDAQASYDFIATMPKAAAENVTINDPNTASSTVTLTNIPLSAPVATGTDYLVSDAATVGADPSAKGTVKFTFKHILSKLNVLAKATYNNETATKVELNSLDLYLPTGKATYKEQNHQGPAATLALATTAGTSTDTWTWDADAKTSETASKVQETAQTMSPSLYKKLTNSYFVAPTPTDLITAAELATKGAQLKMDIKFTVTYKDNTTETFSYAKVDVQDLHTFTQGYITNLYVNINLNEIEFGVDKVISFANVTVADWTDSDDNYIDELGYSFNFKELAVVNAVGTGTTATKIADIDNYGNTKIGTSAVGLTYKTDGNVYSDKACEATNKVDGATSSASLEGGVKVTIPANTTQAVKTYYVKVVTNQGESRVLAFTQAGATPILTATKELGETGATAMTFGSEYTMTVAQLDADQTARVIVIDTTTGEEVHVIPSAGTGTQTVGAADGTKSTIVSGLTNGNTIKFTPVTGHQYSVEIHYEKDPLLYKYYVSNGTTFEANSK